MNDTKSITHEGTKVQTMIVETATHRLVGWGDFDTLAESIRMRVYGHMIVLATPVVKEYHGDLLLDARWIETNLTGPRSFLYTVRHSGTNLGSLAAPLALAINPNNAIMYGLSLYTEDREWYLRVDRHTLMVDGRTLTRC